MSGRFQGMGAWAAGLAVLCALMASPVADGAEKAKPAARKAKPAPAAEAPGPHHSTLPWEVRPNFGISLGDKKLRYALDNGQWRIEDEGGKEIVGNVDMTVTRADGTVFHTIDSTYDNMGVEDIENELGSCRRYVGETKPVHGIDMRNYIDVMKSVPFMLIRADITNVGDQPIEIARISPAVLGTSGEITGLGSAATVATRPLRRRGAFPVYEPQGAPAVALFHDPARKVVLALGAFPLDGTPTAFTLSKNGDAWRGEVVCDYGPGRVLNPGETMTTVPVWLSFHADTPESVDEHFGWALTLLPKAQGADALPDAWVSVAPDQTDQALLAAAQSWSASRVNHVLAPAPWSGGDGYPYDARALANSVRAMKMTPGLTVDPLAVPGAAEELTVAGSDGRRWLNVALPEGRAFAVQAMKRPVEWKYGFFAVAPSPVPDDALRAMGLTRGAADDLAFAIMADAAPGLPVVPTAAGALGGDIDAWLQAAAATARGRMYGVPAGPLALDTAQVKEAGEGLALAMGLYGGPIEIRGPAGSGKLNDLFPRTLTRAAALDPEAQTPKLWQVTRQGRGASNVAVLSFPGAEAWTPQDLVYDPRGPVQALAVGPDGRVSSRR